MFVAVVRGERRNCLLLSCMIFLSRKIHLELQQCFLYLEKHCSNLKKKMEKFYIWRICWSWFLGFVLKKIDLANLLEILFVGIKAQIIYWALGLVWEHEVIRGRINSSGWFKFRVPWVGYKWEGRTRRNIFSDKPSTGQMYIIMFKVNFEGVSMIETFITNVQEG